MPNHHVEVGDRVLSHYEFLNKLSRIKSKQQLREMIEGASRDQLLAIVETCAHVLSSEFDLTPRQKRRLLPYAHFVRRLKRVRSEKGARRVIQEGAGLVHSKQKGGSIGFIASLLVPVLVEAARSIFSK